VEFEHLHMIPWQAKQHDRIPINPCQLASTALLLLTTCEQILSEQHKAKTPAYSFGNLASALASLDPTAPPEHCGASSSAMEVWTVQPHNVPKCWQVFNHSRLCLSIPCHQLSQNPN
jgi:hypothetical protein